MSQPIYSTSVVIDSFKGLNQTGDGANMSMKYAAEMENVNVHNGTFSPMREGKAIPQELDKPIGTLAYLSRRYVTNPDTLMVAVSDGRIYTKEMDGDDDWVQRYPPIVSDVEDGDPLMVSDCDWVTYESNTYPVYSGKRRYAVGERCMYAEPPAEPQTVVSRIYVYQCSRNSITGEWDVSLWRKQTIYYSEGSVARNDIPIYSASETYVKGDYVARNVTEGEDPEVQTYKTYRCNTSITEPEEFTPGHWDEKATYSTYSSSTTYVRYDRVVEEEWEEEEAEEYIPDYKPYRCTTRITTPEEWTSGHWEEISDSDPIDVLLMTNAKDGMYCLYGDTLQVAPVWVTPDPENRPEENIKFGVIARYNERIWGSGIDGDPDKLMYSVPYSPFDWTSDPEIPEDGAGDILQPTWDGDSFVSLRQLGSDLLAIKRNSIWRIYGTNPGEFVMTQQYGGGTIEEDTVAIYNQYAWMMGEHGLMRYDGTGAYPYWQDAIKRFMHDVVNHEKLSLACAAMRNGVYCLAVPINGSDYCNAILEYDVGEGTFSLRTAVSVDSFLQHDERLFYTSATEPGKVFELTDEVGLPLPCKWVSGYQDLGLKNSIKSAFILYMMVDSEAPVELRVGIRTEKKFKQKIVYTKPKKMTRLHLNTQGRTFRLEILSYSGIPFTISGGVKLDLELDPD